MTNWLSERFDRAVRWRADEVVSARVPEVVDERIRQPASEVAWVINELQRLAPQLAALEARVEGQRQNSVLPVAGDETPLETSLLAEIRSEHERIRARLFTVTRYVERLEQLESEVAELKAAIAAQAVGTAATTLKSS